VRGWGWLRLLSLRWGWLGLLYLRLLHLLRVNLIELGFMSIPKDGQCPSTRLVLAAVPLFLLCLAPLSLRRRKGWTTSLASLWRDVKNHRVYSVSLVVEPTVATHHQFFNPKSKNTVVIQHWS
jgi:hypothetical protein